MLNVSQLDYSPTADPTFCTSHYVYVHRFAVMPLTPQPLCNIRTYWSSWLPEVHWISARVQAELKKKANMNVNESTSACSEEPYKPVVRFQTVSNTSCLSSVNIHMLRRWRLCTFRQRVTQSEKRIRLITRLWARWSLITVGMDLYGCSSEGNRSSSTSSACDDKGGWWGVNPHVYNKSTTVLPLHNSSFLSEIPRWLHNTVLLIWIKIFNK